MSSMEDSNLYSQALSKKCPVCYERSRFITCSMKTWYWTPYWAQYRRNKEMKNRKKEYNLKREEETRQGERRKSKREVSDVALYCSGLYNSEYTVSSTHACVLCYLHNTTSHHLCPTGTISTCTQWTAPFCPQWTQHYRPPPPPSTNYSCQLQTLVKLICMQVLM
jgi:hypothetical protein